MITKDPSSRSARMRLLRIAFHQKPFSSQLFPFLPNSPWPPTILMRRGIASRRIYPNDCIGGFQKEKQRAAIQIVMRRAPPTRGVAFTGHVRSWRQGGVSAASQPAPQVCGRAFPHSVVTSWVFRKWVRSKGR